MGYLSSFIDYMPSLNVWVAFVVGLTIGTFVGVFVIGLCQAIAKRDKYEPFCYSEQNRLKQFVRHNKEN